MEEAKVINNFVIEITEPEDDGQTPLDPDEARGLLPDWVSNRDDLNLAEEQNISTGITWGRSVIGRQEVLSEDFLRALHQNMFGRVWEWAGRYRDTERNIGIAPHAISSNLRNLLLDAKAWDQYRTYPLDERAARLHHRLTAIHPFPNGNGRWARVFTNLYLEQSVAAKFSWGNSLNPELRRASYLGAIRLADAHDYSALLEFVRS